MIVMATGNLNTAHPGSAEFATLVPLRDAIRNAAQARKSALAGEFSAENVLHPLDEALERLEFVRRVLSGEV